MAKPLRLVVWLPGETLLDVEEVDWVHFTLAGDKGLTVYPGHAPVLAETVADLVRYEQEGNVHSLDLPAGVLYVRDNVVTLFLSHMVGEEQAIERPDGHVALSRLAQALSERMSRRR